ncbi:hypothetical protein ATANTOWER_017969 [Ataeniobius toweri]|uniref:Uncharacterized protein n=1 Tax=Ataeniobius toweri TaxID=208326 RepID=A0ABU7BZA0_9TELE|nr:hypothetical protein [Ataeniobius toweri]
MMANIQGEICSSKYHKFPLRWFRVSGHSFRARLRSSAIWEELGVEPLLLHIERVGECFRHIPPGGGPGNGP